MWLIALLLVAILSSLVGCYFATASWCIVLLSWPDVASVQAANGQGKIPKALYPFTISALLNMASVLCGFTIAHDPPDGRPGMWLKPYIFPLFMAAAPGFLVVSLIVGRRDSWPGKRHLKVGSITLLVIAVLGSIWLCAG
jgi:hypothetical protein